MFLRVFILKVSIATRRSRRLWFTREHDCCLRTFPDRRQENSKPSIPCFRTNSFWKNKWQSLPHMLFCLSRDCTRFAVTFRAQIKFDCENDLSILRHQVVFITLAYWFHWILGVITAGDRSCYDTFSRPRGWILGLAQHTYASITTSTWHSSCTQEQLLLACLSVSCNDRKIGSMRKLHLHCVNTSVGILEETPTVSRETTEKPLVTMHFERTVNVRMESLCDNTCHISCIFVTRA